MQGSVRKKFDEKLFNENDVPSRQIAIEYFRRHDKVAVENPNKYAIDLIVDDQFYCEVEVKKGWKGSYFPFKDLQIPGRKKKFTQSDKPVMFMIMNNEKTHALVALGEDVMNCPTRMVSNKYVPDGELFYVVPFEKLTKIKLLEKE